MLSKLSALAFGKYFKIVPALLVVIVILLAISINLLFINTPQTDTKQEEIDSLKAQLIKTQNELDSLKSEDQIKINLDQKAEIENIQKTYKQTVLAYESLLDLNPADKNYTRLSELIAKSMGELSERKYSSAQSTLSVLNQELEKLNKIATTETKIPESLNESTNPPQSGYARQQVPTSVGTYMVDIVSADLSNTKVIVDTASESDCTNDCPVLSLGDYVSRNGAFAGINGSYFCPASYPSCSGKTNSFDTLLMNKNKKYFNSDNNVYSNVPAVIFSSGSIRFVSKSLEWGRDTSIDSMIANQPLLVFSRNNVFSGDGEVKRAGKGSRSFVANKGNNVFIGVVHNASASEMAYVLHTMGMDNALNLDSGGSTALWSGGYKVGPGRNIPNAILFVQK